MVASASSSKTQCPSAFCNARRAAAAASMRRTTFAMECGACSVDKGSGGTRHYPLSLRAFYEMVEPNPPRHARTCSGHPRLSCRKQDVDGRDEPGHDVRGVEIISEASRHLTNELKARHPEIPWQKVAGIGNVLRHNYESIAAPVMWKLAQADLPALDRVCREELKTEEECA